MRWILYLFTLPWTLTVGYGWVLLMCLIKAARWDRLRFEGTAILTSEWSDWAKKKWRYSTTLGRGIIYQPGHRDREKELDDRLERHERVHVRQVEDLMFLSFLVGLVVSLVTWNWVLGFVLWWSGGLWQLPNFVTAGLRFGWDKMYRESEHERSAYSRTDIIQPEHVGKSWEQIYDSRT